VNGTSKPVCVLFLCLALPVAAAPARTHVTQVRVPVWLDASAGRELSPEDFRVTFDGAPSRILDVKCPVDELIILLVLDLSSEDLTLDDPAKQALIEQMRKLPPKTYVGLLRSQEGLQVLSDPSTDREAIAAQIEQQTLSGKTGLLATIDAIGGIGDAMMKKSSVRLAILYVTDGDVNNYREDFANPVINSSDSHDLSRRFPETLVQEKIAKLNARLTTQQTPVFIVELNQHTDRLNEAYQNGLKELAETTGGMTFFSRSTAEIPQAIAQSFSTVTSLYSLTLAVPEHVSTRPQIRLTMADDERTLSYRTRIVLRQR
jgi:hypothetical protein